jgi:HAD superfamily hydrolase (TIGR01549 family)
MPLINGPVDWGTIDLVIFDLDGTLYNQKRLRVRMLMQILSGAARSRSLQVPVMLHAFRRCREELGNVAADDFLFRQYEITAKRLGRSIEDVRDVVAEWIERRPLTVIAECTFPGVPELFSALTAANRSIAVFSDYPAEAKLEAMKLHADFIVSAADEDVGQLKPHTAGLHKILKLAGAEPRHSIMIGDRFDRDWEAARRVGMRALIRSRRPHATADTFQSYADELFRPLLERNVGVPNIRRLQLPS